MNKEFELETYLSISPKRFGIYLFDIQNLKNLYKKELVLEGSLNSLDLTSLKEFLDSNIFKIEKLHGKFIKNIFLIIQDENINNLDFGFKKKNYNMYINKEFLENSLIEAKDLFKKNYQSQKIIHMIISKYLIDGKSYSSIQYDIKCDHLILEFKFKSIPINLIDDLNKVLENYQIKVIKYLDGQYLKSFFEDSATDISEMAHRIINGLNENEVIVIPKNPKKSGYFEKFFQLFS
tara:strand:- start:2959 stop:3663 length:705 start_codon:yes stop_codon:yes gene_type:complete